MHDRHASETADLISAQYEERTRVIRTAMEDLLGRKRTEIDDEIAKLKDEGTNDEGKIAQAVEQIGKKYALLQAEVQRSAADDLETKHSQAQLDLRQRQLQEIANALSHLAPQDILVKKQAEQKQRQVEELAEFRRTMETEAQERIDQLEMSAIEHEAAACALATQTAAAGAEETARAMEAVEASEALQASNAELQQALSAAEQSRQALQASLSSRDQQMIELTRQLDEAAANVSAEQAHDEKAKDMAAKLESTQLQLKAAEAKCVDLEMAAAKSVEHTKHRHLEELAAVRRDVEQKLKQALVEELAQTKNETERRHANQIEEIRSKHTAEITNL